MRRLTDLINKRAKTDGSREIATTTEIFLVFLPGALAL